MTSSLRGQSVVVTGAGKGIGAAIARGFGSVGAKVVVNDIDADAAATTAKLIVADGAKALAVVADVASTDEVANLFGAAVEAFGTVDVLVNNASIVSPMTHFLDADAEWFRRIVDVNLMGTIWCGRQAGHLMARQGSGAIINLSSGGASRAHRDFTAYDAAKGGVDALTRAMALDLGPYGVRVNAVMPGSIDTGGASLAERVSRGADLPIERVGESNDLVGPTLFLASDEASYITGEILRVDGGMLAQQRSGTVDIRPPSGFPSVADLRSLTDIDGGAV